MTTSNSTLWELSRNQIIEAALRKLGVLAKGQTPDSEDYTNATIALNGVLALLQTTGMPLWARNEYTMSLVANQATYTIGVGQAVNTPFPLKVHQAILIDSSDSSLELTPISIYDYNALSPLASTGSPVQFSYQPRVNVGTLTVWPTPDTAAATNKTIKLIYQRPFEDFVGSTNTPDFPKEYHQAIIYKLAEALAPEYGIPLQDQQNIASTAERLLQTALSFGSDETSFFIQPRRQ